MGNVVVNYSHNHDPLRTLEGSRITIHPVILFRSRESTLVVSRIGKHFPRMYDASGTVRMSTMILACLVSEVQSWLRENLEVDLNLHDTIRFQSN